MRVHRSDAIKDARTNMVSTQLKTNGVIDRAILNVLGSVPREEFVPVIALPLAYGDGPISCDIAGRHLFAPQTLGLLLQHLKLNETDKVLLVVGNLGYTATVLCELRCKTFVVESNPFLASKCQEKLKKYNVPVNQGPLAEGFSDHAPFNAIIIEAGIQAIPEHFTKQLAENGRIAVCLITDNVDFAKACVFEKKQDILLEVFSIEANMPPCDEFSKPEGFNF